MELKLSEPVKLHEEVTKCPACNQDGMKLEVYLYDVPQVGHVIMTVGVCNKCGYKFRDVRLAESKGPRKLILDIDKPEKLNALVVRAPSATIRVHGITPEGPLEMKPGPVADGFITTVEGVLHRFKEIVEFLCNEPDVDKEKCRSIKRKLEEAINGKRRFVLEIVDPEGVSAIAAKEVRVEPLK